MEKSESLHAVKGKSEKIVFAVFFVIFFLCLKPPLSDGMDVFFFLEKEFGIRGGRSVRSAQVLEV